MSAPCDLLFGIPQISGNPVNLLFGADVEDVPGSAIDVAVELGGLTFAAFVASRVEVDVAVELGSVTFEAVAAYDNRVSRGLSYVAQSTFNDGVPARSTIHDNWSRGNPARHDNTADWQEAGKAEHVHLSAFQHGAPVSRRDASGWEPAGRVSDSKKLVHQYGIPVGSKKATNWQPGKKISTTKALAHQYGLPRRFWLRNSEWGVADKTSTASMAVFRVRKRASVQAAPMPWNVARKPLTGLSLLPGIDSVLPASWDGHLLFECPPMDAMPLYLVFGAHPCLQGPRAPFYILPARFYMTTHYLVGNLLPDLQDVPLYDCTMNADWGSFAWQFSATGPASLFEQLAPSSGIPQRLQITLDGMTWVFLVESIKRDHAFGGRRVSIGGRSVTALIGAPWSREFAYNNPLAVTAQQLAGQSLDLSDVALDWGLTDWLVPANAWSYTGTRLAAVQAIAEAAGGYLQSHRSDAQLLLRHPFPPRPDGSTGGPWNWGTGDADIELAPDTIITSGIERRDGPDINGVYVSGTTQGVLAWVKREGTAGEKLAAMQTDALMTHADAVRQRGLSILAKAGPQLDISLELPILTGFGQPGVIDVGKLVQINESTPWRGRVRGVNVNANMPKARQTIILERYL